MRTVRTPRGVHEDSMETRGGVSNTAKTLSDICGGCLSPTWYLTFGS
jgi:hypothetical protein